MMKVIFGSVTLVLSVLAGCNWAGSPDDIEDRTARLIVGPDNRNDPFALGFEPNYHTQSDVVLVAASAVTDQGNGTSVLSTAQFGPAFNLCPTERFTSQQAGGCCSGFLVAPDIVATAGHCMTGPIACVSTPTAARFIFHFRMDDANTTRTTIPNQDIFAATSIIATQPSGSGDWALVKLDRVVNHRRMAPLRLSGKVSDTADLFSVGHPSGLPYKYTDGGLVLGANGNNQTFGFSHSVDDYQGDSGAMIVNLTSREVEGVQSQGGINNDFVANGSCNVSFATCPGLAAPCDSHFATRTTNFSGTVPGGSSTFFGDVNGGTPKRADLVAVKWNGITVRTSTGSAFGSQASWTPDAYYGVLGTFLVDVTGDGKADAVVVNDPTVSTPGVTVRRANSGGSGFGSNEAWANTGKFFGDRGTYLADVTHDGKADLILIQNNSIIVRRANSAGTAFSATEETWSAVGYYATYGNYFADVTGDGRADAIVVEDTRVTVRRANSTSTGFNGNESWTAGAYFGDVGTYFADVTGDGKADAIVVNAANVTVRRANAGATGFDANETWISGAFFGQRGTMFADVTGDGRADIIAVNQQNVTVRPANSTGTAFSAAVQWLGSGDFGTVGVFFSSQH